MIKAIMASPVVRKTAAAAMFMTAVAGMGAVRAENNQSKANYESATNEMLPSAYPLVQAQTSKPMVRVRNTALENKVISFSETAAEEIENRQYTKEFNDEFGTYVSAVVMQNFIDIETFKNYIKNEYPYKKNTEILLDWLNAYENSFNEVIRPLCKEENPYSPEEVLKHIETFNMDFINDRGKGRYFNVDKPSIDEDFKPSTPLEWSNYIATCLCCLESWIFLTGLGFNMYGDDARKFYKAFKTALPK